jgi:hypothetical protein
MVASWFESPTNHSLVALRDGAVVGVALLTGAGKLALCYLLPEAQRQGAGTALLRRMEERAEAAGMKALYLHSTATAEGFFATRGYRRDGNVRSPYGVETIQVWKPLVQGVQPDARKRFCNCNSACGPARPPPALCRHEADAPAQGGRDNVKTVRPRRQGCSVPLPNAFSSPAANATQPSCASTGCVAIMARPSSRR